MRPHCYRLFCALFSMLLCLSLAAGVFPTPAHADAPTPSEIARVQARLDAADAALTWLAGRHNADGGFGLAGASDWESTAWAVESYLARGRDASLLRTPAGLSPAEYLASASGSLPADAYAYAHMILAGTALGEDPCTFLGHDWPSALRSTLGANGRFAGTMATAVETQALAIVALRASYESVPAGALTWLKSATNADGGWGPAVGAASDAYHTGLALWALRLAGEPAENAPIRAGVAFLHAVQRPDGGFSLRGTASDALATSAAIAGLAAAGELLYDASWTKGGKIPFDALRALQSADGSFLHPDSAQADIRATAAGVMGWMGSADIPRHPRVAARRALGWLRAQQEADGGFGHVNSTAGAVYVIARAGDDPDSLAWTPAGTSALDALARDLPTYVGGPSSRVAEAGKAAMAVVAAGQDPRAFGGYDLVALIQGYYNPQSGRYYETWLYRHNLAVKGLVMAGSPVPDGARRTLLEDQKPTGGWGWAFGSSNPDVDSTGLTVQTLAWVGQEPASPALTQAKGFLSSAQFPDGTLPAILTNPSGNANSTALAIQGLSAMGVDLHSVPFARLEATGCIVDPVRALLRFQEDSGAFMYTFDLPENRLMAVFDAVPALMDAAPPAEIQVLHAQIRHQQGGRLLILPYFGDGNGNAQVRVRVRHDESGSWSDPLSLARSGAVFTAPLPPAGAIQVQIEVSDPDGVSGEGSQTLLEYQIALPLIVKAF